MEELEIYYNNKKLVNDEFLKPSETQVEPKIKYNFKSNNLYTLIMHDPDAVNGNRVHWLVTNINKNINNGKILLPYVGPAPPAKTGKHRYIFELYNRKFSCLLNHFTVFSKPFLKPAISLYFGLQLSSLLALVSEANNLKTSLLFDLMRFLSITTLKS